VPFHPPGYQLGFLAGWEYERSGPGAPRDFTGLSANPDPALQIQLPHAEKCTYMLTDDLARFRSAVLEFGAALRSVYEPPLTAVLLRLARILNKAKG